MQAIGMNFFILTTSSVSKARNPSLLSDNCVATRRRDASTEKCAAARAEPPFCESAARPNQPRN